MAHGMDAISKFEMICDAEINSSDEMTFYLVNVIPWKSYNIFSGNENKKSCKIFHAQYLFL
jgi:hypothetical protein